MKRNEEKFDSGGIFDNENKERQKIADNKSKSFSLVVISVAMVILVVFGSCSLGILKKNKSEDIDCSNTGKFQHTEPSKLESSTATATTTTATTTTATATTATTTTTTTTTTKNTTEKERKTTENIEDRMKTFSFTFSEDHLTAFDGYPRRGMFDGVTP